MKIIFILMASFLFANCAHHKNTSTPIHIDTSLLIPFDQALKDVSTAKSPALYKFTKNGKTLWYLAANHNVDVSSDTFRFIRHVFNANKIELVILEGFETELGLSPKSITDYALKGKTTTFYPQGEPSYAVELANQKKIPFVGGEPSEKYIYNAIIDKGYSAQDLIGFYFVRQIPQLIRSQEVNSLNGLQEKFESYSKMTARDIGIKELRFTFAEFKKWYKIKQSKDLSLHSGEKGETAPMDGPYYTQKMSKTITKIRDEHILSTIGDMLNRHREIFIVYGSSHYRIEHLALKAALGSPVEVELKDIK